MYSWMAHHLCTAYVHSSQIIFLLIMMSSERVPKGNFLEHSSYRPNIKLDDTKIQKDSGSSEILPF